MSPENRGPQLYVRFRGNLFGPYLPDELRIIAERARTTDKWEISFDKENWRPLGQLDALLAASLGGPPSATANQGGPSGGPFPWMDSPHQKPEYPTDFPPQSDSVEHQPGHVDLSDQAADTESEWYYAIEGQQLGPVPESQLAAMARNGEIPPDTLVWTLNMTEWRPLSETRVGRRARHLSAEEKAPPVAQPPTSSAAMLAGKGYTFSEELEATLDGASTQLRLWLYVLLVASALNVLVCLLALFGISGMRYLSFFGQMACSFALLALAILAIRTISSLRLGSRFLTRPRNISEIYLSDDAQKTESTESPWSNPVLGDNPQVP